MKRRGIASTTSSAGAGKPAETTLEKKMERKTIEKLRRIKMKELCFELVSHIPSTNFHPAMLSQQDQLEKATNYITQLRENVDQMKERKAKLTHDSVNHTKSTSFVHDPHYPIMEIRDLGSSLQVILITRSERNFMLFEAISILQDEGAEVVGVNVTTVDNKVYHTLHALVKNRRVGVVTSRIGGRLHEMISVVKPLIVID